MAGSGRPQDPNVSENDDVGLPSFSSRDWVATAAGLAERQPDVAIVGAPFDINTTHRAGARFGPRAVRSAAYDPGSYHLDLGLDIFELLDVVDAGDAYARTASRRGRTATSRPRSPMCCAPMRFR